MGPGGLSIIQDENDSNQDSDYSDEEEKQPQPPTTQQQNPAEGAPPINGTVENNGSPFDIDANLTQIAGAQDNQADPKLQ